MLHEQRFDFDLRTQEALAMSSAFVAAHPSKGSFTCMKCGALTGHTWSHPTGIHAGIGSMHSKCQNRDCNGFTIWLVELVHDALGNVASYTDEPATQVLPVDASGPLPHPDLDDSISASFNEARAVLHASGRAASALMRVVVEDLVMTQLKRTEANLNAAIGALVAEGLNPMIQQALDVVRVTGNSAAHPGQLIDTDDKDVALELMEFTNLIVQQIVTAPAEVAAAFAALPESKLKGIQDRDDQAEAGGS